MVDTAGGSRWGPPAVEPVAMNFNEVVNPHLPGSEPLAFSTVAQSYLLNYGTSTSNNEQ